MSTSPPEDPQKMGIIHHSEDWPVWQNLLLEHKAPPLPPLCDEVCILQLFQRRRIPLSSLPYLLSGCSFFFRTFGLLHFLIVHFSPSCSEKSFVPNQTCHSSGWRWSATQSQTGTQHSSASPFMSRHHKSKATTPEDTRCVAVKAETIISHSGCAPASDMDTGRSPGFVQLLSSGLQLFVSL